MSAQQALSIDLNIDHMRARIYQEMAEVCRPFYKRLEQLDNVEDFLKSEQRSLVHHNARHRAWETRKTRRKAKIVRAEPVPPKALHSGTGAGAYRMMSQPDAILDIVSREPGLGVHEITRRMVEGGYPFKGRKPVDAMYVAMRNAVHKKLIRQDSDGQKVIYFPIGTPQRPVHAPRGVIADSILKAIAEGPDSGMTRKEVFDQILANGFVFDKGSAARPDKRLNWSLQNLYDAKRIDRSGKGSGALFSRPKLTPTKHA